MNSSARKRLRLISLRENGPAIKAGFTKTVNAASPASCHIKSRSKFSPIKKPFAAVSTGTSCYQSRSKSGCFFEPCSLCTRYTPDAWIPMDASFKQYTYSDGMDLQQAVPLDAAAHVTCYPAVPAAMQRLAGMERVQMCWKAPAAPPCKGCWRAGKPPCTPCARATKPCCAGPLMWTRSAFEGLFRSRRRKRADSSMNAAQAAGKQRHFAPRLIARSPRETGACRHF